MVTLDTKPHRSVSQLTTYLNCAESYRLSKVAKAPRRPAAWLLQGVAFHAAIEFWEGKHRQPDLYDVQDVFLDSWDDLHSELLDVDPDRWLTGTPRRKGGEDIRQRKAKGLQQTAEYMSWAESRSEEWRVAQYSNGNPMVEVSFELELNGTKVIGSIDQVIEYRNGALRVRDLKTGTKRPSWPVQLGVYALALRELCGLPVTWGDYYMSKDIDATKPYDLAVYTRDNVASWFNQLDRAIAEEIFIPSPGDMCGVCDVWEFCSVNGPRRSEYPPKREKAEWQTAS